jgi:hypothetical protein
MDTLLAANLNLTNFRSVDTGIVAHAGGTSVPATQLKKLVNRIDTVASAGDSVSLPPAKHGLVVKVTNNTATSCNVFPYAGDAINALAADAAYALAGNKTVEFICELGGSDEMNAHGAWYTIPA